MAAPCINDTCSISSLIDPITRRLSLNANLSPSGGLVCVDGQGLGVHIIGDPPPAAFGTFPDDTLQTLGITPGGELWSIPRSADIINFGSSVASIPSDGSETGGAGGIAAGTITNPYSNPALLIMTARMEVGWTIDGVPDASSLHTAAGDSPAGGPTGIAWIPYAAELATRLKVDAANAQNIGTAYHSISGVWLTAETPHNGRDYKQVFHARVIGASDTVAMSASAQLILPTTPVGYPYNLDFSAGPSFVDRGFKVSGQAIVFPFGAV